MGPRILLAVAAACAACAEEPGAVWVVDGAGDDWALVARERGRLEDLDRVDGPDLTFWVSSRLGEMTIDPEDPPRDRGLDAEDFLWGAEEPQAGWVLDGGVALATDFDSLAMFTAYTQLDRALDFYADLGAREEVVSSLHVHYAPDGGVVGNAVYNVGADALMLLRPHALEELPLAMNTGVLTHELGHRLFYWETWDARYFEVVVDVDTVGEARAYYALQGLGEGTSDYFGAVLTDDPAYITRSMPGVSDDRDLSVLKPADPTWETLTEVILEGAAFDPHDMGAVFAAAAWAVGEELGHDEVAHALLEALRDVSPQAVGLDYAFGELEVELVRRLGPDACAPFLDAYAPIADRFDEVCP